MVARRALVEIDGEVQEVADGDFLAATPKTYFFPVENPISGDDIPRIYVPRQFQVTEIRALRIGGGGSFDWRIGFSTSADDVGAGTTLHSATGVTNNTTGVSYTPPFTTDPPYVPAGRWMWLELSNVSTGLSRPVMVEVQVMGFERGT